MDSSDSAALPSASEFAESGDRLNYSVVTTVPNVTPNDNWTLSLRLKVMNVLAPRPRFRYKLEVDSCKSLFKDPLNPWYKFLGDPKALSTLINTDTPITTKPPAGSTLTFSELIERLNSQQTTPTLEDLNNWVANVEITDHDLKPYLGFKEGNYWRHRVCRNEGVEMLVICWRPGQKTPIHDHNGSHGVVRVQKGLMWETIFRYDDEQGLCYDTARECPTGTVTGAEVPDIHQLGNPDVSGQDLITIHVYAPPLGVLKTYKVGSPKIDLYTPNDFPT